MSDSNLKLYQALNFLEKTGLFNVDFNRIVVGDITGRWLVTTTIKTVGLFAPSDVGDVRISSTKFDNVILSNFTYIERLFYRKAFHKVGMEVILRYIEGLQKAYKQSGEMMSEWGALTARPPTQEGSDTIAREKFIEFISSFVVPNSRSMPKLPYSEFGVKLSDSTRESIINVFSAFILKEYKRSIYHQ